MVKNIALVKPEVAHPVKRQGLAGDVGLPTGLLYLASYLREYNGMGVSVVDHRLKRALGQEIDMEQEFANADIVGVGACTAEAPGAFDVLRKAKQMGKITVAGGLFPTFNHEEVLRNGHADFVVFGEGESGLAGLVNALNGKQGLLSVKGIAFEKAGLIVKNEGKEMIRDLDSIPIPAYDLVDMAAYAQFSPASIYAARGCPMTCNFCTLNELWEYSYRRRSFDNIIAELDLFKQKGFKRTHFKDETITLNARWCGELFSEIEKAGLGMKYKAKSRMDGLEPALLEQMMAAGVDTIHTGVESPSQKTLDSMEKRVRTQQIAEGFDLLLDKGCKVNPVYMLGWPGEEPADLAESARFIIEMGQRPGVITYVSFITPHPGSSLVEELGDQLRVVSTDLSRYTHKQPVAVPRSLGDKGLQIMVDHYHQIAEACGMQDVNPRVDQAYIDEVAGNDLAVRKIIKPSCDSSNYVQLNVGVA